MEEILLTSGHIVNFVIAVIVLITFFTVASRIKKLYVSTQHIERILGLNAQKNGEAIISNCTECGTKTEQWIIADRRICSMCGISYVNEQNFGKKSNAKPGVKAKPEDIRKAAAEISKINGVTDIILSSGLNHLTIKFQPKTISIEDLQKELKSIQDLGVETATLLA